MFAEEGVVYFTMAWAAKRIPEAQATLSCVLIHAV